MNSIRTIVLLVMLLPMTIAQAQRTPEQEKYARAMQEMKTLVEPGSMSRNYLYCAVLSSNLNLGDMYGLFVRKTFEITQNPEAFTLALSYMTGFFDNESLQQKRDMSSEQYGELLGNLYKIQCLKQVLSR